MSKPPVPRRTTIASLAVAVVATVLPFAASVALAPGAVAQEPTGSRQAADEGACTDGNGVTVVINFQELGGGTYVRCAPNAPATGFAALQQAGISYQTTLRSAGFLCRIANKPANDPCVVPSPADAYWSYWMAPRGGTWCYSNYGAGNRRPVPGTVEGWSFSLNKTAVQTPNPGYVPAPLGSGPQPQIPAKDCTVPTEGAGTTTTAPPTPTTKPPTPPTVPPATSGSGSGGGSGSTPGPSTPGPNGPSGSGGANGNAGTTPGTGTGPAGVTTTTSKDAKATTTSTAGSSTTTATSGTAAGASGDTDSPSGRGSDGGGDETAAAPLNDGSVDLGDDGGSGGSPLPLIIVMVLAAGVGVAGYFAKRRQRPPGTAGTAG